MIQSCKQLARQVANCDYISKQVKPKYKGEGALFVIDKGEIEVMFLALLAEDTLN